MIYERFYEHVVRSPGKVALICGNITITYAGLQALVRRNMEKYDPHLKWLVQPIQNDVEGVIMLLACAAKGIALYPVKPDTSRSALQRAVDGLEPVVDQVTAHPFLLLNTSGTTGDPKLIAITQDTKMLRMLQFEVMYDTTVEDVFLVGTPLHTSMAQRLVLTALTTGATAHLLTHYSPELWLASAKQCTVVVGVPMQLQHLSSDTGRIRLVLSSSAPRLHDNGLLSAVLATVGVEYHECYGAAEVAIATSGLTGDSVGLPAPGVRVKISAEGEILVKSKLKHSGYLGRPDLTQASTTLDGYFKTGDAGVLRDGLLYLTGRLSERIKVGATTVWPEDVERVVRQMPAVIDCAATGFPDDKLGQVVVISVVSDTLVTLKEIQRFCIDKLDDAQLPRICRPVNTIPRTELGKLQRRKVK